MPKYIRIRPKALRPNYSSPRLGDFSKAKMATAGNSNIQGTSSMSQSPKSVRLLVQRLIDRLTRKQPLTSLRGFDAEFSCSRCSQLLFRPVTGPCGNSFCSGCTKETARCKHCEMDHEPTSFFKLNVVLNTILEHWYPEEYRMRTMSQEGDQLLKRGDLKSAEIKFSEAVKQNPYDLYALRRRAFTKNEAGDWKNALADIISAKIRGDVIPEAFKKSGRQGFSRISSEEENIVQIVIKMFLEVMSLLSAPSTVPSSACPEEFFDSPEWCQGDRYTEIPSPITKTSTDVEPNQSEDDFDNEETISELESALNTIIAGNVSNFVTLCNEEVCAPKKRAKRMSEDSKEFDETDFCCILCTRPFYDPVCTPCGHTFCLDCLERCFDHGRSCPMCKTSLKDIYQYQECLLPIDRSTDAIIKKHLPVLSSERLKSREEERKNFSEKLPVFVCTVAFPGVKCMLHVFEPRYRLMIRRATRVHDGNFGMTIGSTSNPFHKVGTIINMQNVSFYQDGRSLVTSVGTRRFEAVEYSTCDGYNTAKVEFIVDQEESAEDAEETQRIAAEIYKKGEEWFSRQSDRFKQVVKAQFGSFPEQDNSEGDNGPNWPWWLLAILPVKDEIKAYILAKDRLRARLALIKLILQKIERNHGIHS